MRFIRRLLPNSTVERRYVSAGGNFGDAVSYLVLGECIGFKDLLNKWAKWEEEYARRGFRTVSLDRFVDFGGYGKSIDDVLGQKRENSEEPIFYAQKYREQFLGKVEPVLDIQRMLTDGKPQRGEYNLPSIDPNKEN